MKSIFLAILALSAMYFRYGFADAVSPNSDAVAAAQCKALQVADF
jgi:hypothetical protein